MKSKSSLLAFLFVIALSVVATITLYGQPSNLISVNEHPKELVLDNQIKTMDVYDIEGELKYSYRNEGYIISNKNGIVINRQGIYEYYTITKEIESYSDDDFPLITYHCTDINDEFCTVEIYPDGNKIYLNIYYPDDISVEYVLKR